MIKVTIAAIIAASAVLVSNLGLAAVAEPGTYSVDKAHTNIGFEVSHMGVSMVVGRFNSFDGSFKFEPNGQSSVNFEIDVASVDTNNDRRDRHLRSKDFFEVNKYPKMTFSANQVTYDEEGNPLSVTGPLSLHGVSKDVTLNVVAIGAVEDAVGDVRAGFRAETKILRTDFGMDRLLGAALNEVTIIINIEGIRQ